MPAVAPKPKRRRLSTAGAVVAKSRHQQAAGMGLALKGVWPSSCHLPSSFSVNLLLNCCQHPGFADPRYTDAGTAGQGPTCVSIIFIAFIYNIYLNLYNNFNLITSKFDLVRGCFFFLFNTYIKLGLYTSAGKLRPHLPKQIFQKSNRKIKGLSFVFPSMETEAETQPWGLKLGTIAPGLRQPRDSKGRDLLAN